MWPATLTPLLLPDALQDMNDAQEQYAQMSWRRSHGIQVHSSQTSLMTSPACFLLDRVQMNALKAPAANGGDVIIPLDAVQRLAILMSGQQGILASHIPHVLQGIQKQS